MLKSWSIENFKAIVNSGDLKLAPITILAGKNSSGKSSLLQSILMIAQTLSNQNRDLALLTNGDLAKLRTFEDILSDYTQSNSIRIKFELIDESEELESNIRASTTQIVFVTFSSASGSKLSSSAIEASKVIVEDSLLKFSSESEGPAYSAYDEDRLQEPEWFVSSDEFELHMKKIPDNELKRYWESEAAKNLRQKPSHIGTIKNFGGVLSEGEFIANLFHFFPAGLAVVSDKKVKDLDPEEDLESDSFPVLDLDILMVNPDITSGVEQLTRFFTTQIRYLGPFRAKPDITAQGFSTKGNIDDVGIEGEYAASVYHANQNAAIDWYNPASKQVEQGTLKGALDAWVQHLRIAHQVTTEVAGLAGVMWKVVLIEGQKAHTLPEVGVGLSQILPILVTGLLSPKDSLLIMEQPELHLHSQVQARLGDFFVGIAKCHKQCIIETHSENIVSQLRYHIVEAGGQDKSNCIIYFVDQDEKGAAKFEPIEISPNGNILNWPDGFFDETMHQEDRITAASIRKRAKKAKNG